MLLIKVEFFFVFIYCCTEQLNLKNISYWHYFTTKIMSICPIWNFTLYVTQSLHFLKITQLWCYIFTNTGLKCWSNENFHHWSRHAHRQRIALWVISLVLATQHTYIQSMLNLARFISFLLYKSLSKYTLFSMQHI